MRSPILTLLITQALGFDTDKRIWSITSKPPGLEPHKREVISAPSEMTSASI